MKIGAPAKSSRAGKEKCAFPGTVPQGNSLSLHGKGRTFGVLRLLLRRAAPSESLRMTREWDGVDGEGTAPATKNN